MSSYECGRVFAYWPNGSRFQREHVQTYDKSGRKSVPVWGAFCAHGPSSLIRIEGHLTGEQYCTILDDELLPMIDRYYGGRPVKFIQDQSPIHKSRIVKQWFEENPTIEVLPWPPKGADLYPIENVWGDMVSDMNDTAQARSTVNSNELFNIVNTIWEEYHINIQKWRTLGFSMLNRLTMCLLADGYWTKYWG